MTIQKEPLMTLFSEKFGETAAKLYDVIIREDRYFVSEILALDSFIARLDDIPFFSNQLVMINIATLDVFPQTTRLTVGNLSQARSTISTVSHCLETIHPTNQHSANSFLGTPHRNNNHNSAINSS